MADGTHLSSWKEIAGHLRVSERTARRWEKREGLPVYRHMHEQRGSVYAWSGEVERWRASRTLGTAQRSFFPAATQVTSVCESVVIVR